MSPYSSARTNRSVFWPRKPNANNAGCHRFQNNLNGAKRWNIWNDLNVSLSNFEPLNRRKVFNDLNGATRLNPSINSGQALGTIGTGLASFKYRLYCKVILANQDLMQFRPGSITFLYFRLKYPVYVNCNPCMIFDSPTFPVSSNKCT